MWPPFSSNVSGPQKIAGSPLSMVAGQAAAEDLAVMLRQRPGNLKVSELGMTSAQASRLPHSSSSSRLPSSDQEHR
jgi:hypothetical protein